MRFTYPFTASATLQVYAQPFVSKGTYSNVQRLSATPRAADFASRYVPDTVAADNPGGFNYKQFRSNVVFRWEYRPGSTLFLVWSQGRQNSTGAEGTQGFRGDLSDLFGLRPDNSFLVKLSYWTTRKAAAPPRPVPAGIPRPARRAPGAPWSVPEPARPLPRASTETSRSASRHCGARRDHGAPAPPRLDSCGCLS